MGPLRHRVSTVHKGTYPPAPNFEPLDCINNLERLPSLEPVPIFQMAMPAQEQTTNFNDDDKPVPMVNGDTNVSYPEASSKKRPAGK